MLTIQQIISKSHKSLEKVTFSRVGKYEKARGGQLGSRGWALSPPAPTPKRRP